MQFFSQVEALSTHPVQIHIYLCLCNDFVCNLILQKIHFAFSLNTPLHFLLNCKRGSKTAGTHTVNGQLTSSNSESSLKNRTN